MYTDDLFTVQMRSIYAEESGGCLSGENIVDYVVMFVFMYHQPVCVHVWGPSMGYTAGITWVGSKRFHRGYDRFWVESWSIAGQCLGRFWVDSVDVICVSLRRDGSGRCMYKVWGDDMRYGGTCVGMYGWVCGVGWCGLGGPRVGGW